VVKALADYRIDSQIDIPFTEHRSFPFLVQRLVLDRQVKIDKQLGIVNGINPIRKPRVVKNGRPIFSLKCRARPNNVWEADDKKFSLMFSQFGVTAEAVKP
jgi:hypothetical protein